MNSYGIIRILGVVVLLAGASAQCLKEFTIRGERIDAYMNPADGKLIGANTPVWIAHERTNGSIQLQMMEKGYVGNVMAKFYASNPDIFTLGWNRRKRDNPSFDEIVSGLRIRSLPKRFQKKSTSVTEQDKIRRLERQIREASRSDNRTHRSTVKRSDMEYIYPSLLVQTTLATSLEPDIIDFDNDIVYQIAFWNSVDLLFRMIRNPKIRIRIAGIIIGDWSLTAYMQKNVFAENTAIEMGKCWYGISQSSVDIPLSAYHIFVAMTNTTDQSGSEMMVTSGPSLCETPQDAGFVPTGIFSDDARLGGTSRAAHLLGKILGVFEGDLIGGECQIPEHCLLNTRNEICQNWKWCERLRFSNLARQGFLDCYAQPAEFYPPGDAVRRVFPGDFVNADAQCKSRIFDYARACEPSSDTCSQLQCRFGDLPDDENPCVSTGPPAEGTTCGPDHKCVQGLCQCMTERCMYMQH